MNNNNFTSQQLNKAKQALIYLNNLNIIMKTLFTPIKQIQQEHNCTQDEAIIKIQKAYDFTQKYTFTYLQETINSLKPIVNTLMENNDNEK